MRNGERQSSPTELIPALRKTTAMLEFLRTEAGGGIVLILSAALAIIWANSQWADSYDALIHAYVTIGTESQNLSMSVQHWVNDGLMVVFFLVVGLEIKREALIGELSSVERAAIPVASALGGAIVPALIYLAIARGDERHGWGIPMATDIAFALGVLALVASGAPLGLRIFLMALAIVDDLLAIVVIAVFYSETIRLEALAIAGGCLLILIALNRFNLEKPAVFAVVGLCMWYALLKSGVHATIAGVLIAMCIPVTNNRGEDEFVTDAQAVIDSYKTDNSAHHRTESVLELEILAERATPPAQRLIHALHPWVAFMIVPIFAFINAGLEFGDAEGLNRVSLGIVMGLVIGKPLGIAVTTWIMTRLKIGALPEGVGMLEIVALGALAGIGFTMSLFITDLAFDDLGHINQAKSGILAASVLAAVLGAAAIKVTSHRHHD